MTNSDKKLENFEFELLINAIKDYYGYDFTLYAHASLKRRMLNCLRTSSCNNLTEMLAKLLHDKNFFNHILLEISVTVTEMFRDPDFYIAVREKIVPVLKTYPYIKIWHAGCATGEEVYSMAILLDEAGLLDKATIYATDCNVKSIKLAKDGIYSMDQFSLYEKNYKDANGECDFNKYFHKKYNSCQVIEKLRKKITFSHHNLVTDSSFGEMNLIVCRNVMIYFSRELQGRVFQLFTDSLCHRGFLGLGNKETLEFTDVRKKYDIVDSRERIYRLI